MVDEVLGWRVNVLDTESLVEADAEDEFCRVVEMVDEVLGWRYKVLDRESLVEDEADDEFCRVVEWDEVFRAVETVGEVPCWLVKLRGIDFLGEADVDDEVCRLVWMVDEELGWLVEIFNEVDADDEVEAIGGVGIVDGGGVRRLAKVVNDWDFDRVIEADDKDEVCQLLEMIDGEFEWLAKRVDKGGVDDEVDWLAKVEATLVFDVLDSTKDDLTNEEFALWLSVLLGETDNCFVENGVICGAEVSCSLEVFVWGDVDCPGAVKNDLLDEIFSK